MSDDIEALLRGGMAERAAAAPAYDDPGLADAVIAGAGRIRRRRRVASAASGAGLLVLGAAAFVWQPWAGPGGDDGGADLFAADTSTVEAQDELAMEFAVRDPDGTYSVINQDGARIPLGDTEPYNVFRLADTYLADSGREVWTVGFDGEPGIAYEKESPEETRTQVNSAGEQFAMVTTTEDYQSEQVLLYDAAEAEEPIAFTTSLDIRLEDWNATTAVFSGNLHSTTGGEAGDFFFNDVFDLGLETVGAAGFESAILVDQRNSQNICVSDLDPDTGTANGTERCGPVDSEDVRAALEAATGEEESDPHEIARRAIEAWDQEYPIDLVELGDYEDRIENAVPWIGPNERWQVMGYPDGSPWLLIDATGDDPVVSELEPPEGALMPVLSYT